MAYRGDKVKIKKSGVVICTGINQKDINIHADLIDDTANSNRGFSVYLPMVDTKSIGLDFKGIAKDRVLRKLRLMDENLIEGITCEFANGDTVTGNFMIADYSESGGYKDAVQFSCSLRSSGPYTFTFSDGGGGGGGGAEMVFKAIGSFSETGFTGLISDGALKGACTIYDPYTGAIECMVQRPCLLNPSDGYQPDFAICAVDGDYAICREANDYSYSNYVAVVPILKDGAMVFESEWFANTLRSFPPDQTCSLIQMADQQVVHDIILLESGNFLVIGATVSYGSPVTIFNVKRVTFTDEMTHEVFSVDIDLSSFNVKQYDYADGVAGAQAAYNYETGECAMSFNVKSAADSSEVVISFKLDVESMEVSDVLANEGWALARMTVVTERVIAWGGSAFVDASCDVSFDQLKIAGLNNGKTIEVSSYVSRTAGLSPEDTVYSDLDYSTINAAQLMHDHFVSIGFAPTFDPSDDIRYGAVGAFLSGPNA